MSGLFFIIIVSKQRQRRSNTADPPAGAVRKGERAWKPQKPQNKREAIQKYGRYYGNIFCG